MYSLTVLFMLPRFSALALSTLSLLTCVALQAHAQDQPKESDKCEIKELKTTLAVDVLTSRSKVFRTKQKIKRVAVSDPSVAEIVLMSENQIVVIGKNPGAINVTVWCEK